MKKQKKSILLFLAVSVLLMGAASASAGYLLDKDSENPSSEIPSSIDVVSSEEVPSSETPSISEDLSSIVSSEPPSSQPDLLPLNDSLPTIAGVGDSDAVLVDFIDQTFLNQTGWSNYSKKTFTADAENTYYASSYAFTSNSTKYYSYTGQDTLPHRKLALGWTSTSLLTMEMKHPALEQVKAAGKNYVYLESQFFITRISNQSYFSPVAYKDGVNFDDYQIYLREKGSAWFLYNIETELLPSEKSDIEYQFMIVYSSSNVNFRVEMNEISIGTI